MKLSTKWLAGACLWLGVGLRVFSDDIAQTWLLSEPRPTASGSEPSATVSSSPARKYQVSTINYQLPDVSLINANGDDISLQQLLNAEGPVVLQFVFVTCSTICPILSASLASAQADLDQLSNGKQRFISISIDPEQDTPEQLHAYAKRFKADGNWHFLTGTPNDIKNVLKAFDASYAGNNKMFHLALTFMRPGPDSAWRRINGLLGKQDLIAEYKQMLAMPD
ncbi:MAG: SCO family protein [Methylomonas sp.]|uniref:SCO family protein n=1 Tax=Methylomonas sp. TaxID=418 RepID=UPI0025FCCEA0|nr:SCO family protein [Methylomonas sp.]MCK9606658.1 SCO family protein [Methylomonas sp.]